MALAYRSFFAFGRPLARSDGFPTSAIYGTAVFLHKLLGEETPDFVAVALESDAPTFRHEMYSEYKATRSDMPEDLRRQLPHIQELFENLKLPIIKASGYEADDVIGSLAKFYSGPDCQVIIVSGDKDFFQLVDENISVLIPKKNEDALRMGPAEVFERFGCRPDQVVDVLALMGDSVDNVPGVPSIGEKTASALIARFGSLDQIYAHLDEIKSEKQRLNLQNHRNDALLSKKLVTITTSIPITHRLDDLRCDPRVSMGNDDILAFYDRFEFKQLATRARAILPAQTPGFIPPALPTKTLDADRTYTLVESISAFPLAKILASDVIGIALGPNGLDPIVDPWSWVSFYTEGMGYVMPLNAETRPALAQIFASTTLTKAFHGVKECLQLATNTNLPIAPPYFDIKVADYLIDPSIDQHGLDACCIRHLGVSRVAITDLDKIIDDTTLNQLCRDAEMIFHLYKTTLQKLNDKKLSRVFYEIDLPLTAVLADVEKCGVRVDKDFLEIYSQELTGLIADKQGEIYARVGHEFNIQSPKQLQKVLFDELRLHEVLGLKRLKRTKTGFSTDESVLAQMSKHEVPSLIIEYRLLSKIKNAFVDTLPSFIHPQTKRLHTKLHQTVAATGRLSSDSPNLQNIPMRTLRGQHIRRAFLPLETKHVLVSADYSQVEIRLLAHFAKAEDLIEAFKKGLDIHKVTAAKIFGVPESQVSKDMRSQAKAINFGIIYGMGPQRLAQETGVSMTAAKEFISKYFEAYPGIKTYTEHLIRSARSLGYSETMFGRKRPLANINDANRAILARAENMAVNSPIQGSAADIIKVAMIKLHHEFQRQHLGARLILQIHDELLFSCPKTELDQVLPIIKECMEHAVETSVPLVVEIGVGDHWLDAH